MLKKSLLFTLALSSLAICEDVRNIKPIPNFKPLAYRNMNVKCPEDKFCDIINAVGYSTDTYTNDRSLLVKGWRKVGSASFTLSDDNHKRIYYSDHEHFQGILKINDEYYPIVGYMYVSNENNISLYCRSRLETLGNIDYKKCGMHKIYFYSTPAQ